MYVNSRAIFAVVITPHPEREQIQLPHVLAALGNALRLRIARVLADGGEHAYGTVLNGESPACSGPCISRTIRRRGLQGPQSGSSVSALTWRGRTTVSRARLATSVSPSRPHVAMTVALSEQLADPLGGVRPLRGDRAEP